MRPRQKLASQAKEIDVPLVAAAKLRLIPGKLRYDLDCSGPRMLDMGPILNFNLQAIKDLRLRVLRAKFVDIMNSAITFVRWG